MFVSTIGAIEWAYKIDRGLMTLEQLIEKERIGSSLSETIMKRMLERTAKLEALKKLQE